MHAHTCTRTATPSPTSKQIAVGFGLKKAVDSHSVSHSTGGAEHRDVASPVCKVDIEPAAVTCESGSKQKLSLTTHIPMKTSNKHNIKGRRKILKSKQQLTGSKQHGPCMYSVTKHPKYYHVPSNHSASDDKDTDR
ncbi:unnamed protein product [Ceratitis capitata]|uniref:(Mediterranean fruit fly) hypothetical protein n=1 Tax=Ceratitis capitata TaxID=7213 RepID=A0A811UNC2_CERCA|nr:unnamed protein product [Ceratitis capitata]